MRKGTFIDGILVIAIIISSCIVGLSMFTYWKTNYTDNQVATINIINQNNAKQEQNKTSYPIETLEATGETIFEGNTQYTQNTFNGIKYYYNQLDDYAKIIYQAFEDNIENMKTGNYKIQFEDEFDELLKQDNGNDILNDEFQRAWDAFSYDRPDIFYLNPNKFSITVETSKRGLKTSYNVYFDSGNNGIYLDDGFSNKQQINDAIIKLEQLKKQFVNQMSVMSNDYEKVKSLHDWIINNIEYDSNMQNINRYNIYGALIDRNVVCEGYAKLFKYILDDIGIESVLVSGIAVNSEGTSERHMWNYVKINEIWYAVDCTWDDPVIIGNGKVGNDIKYKYFLKGTNFYKDHTEEPITDKSITLTYPKISQQDY